MVSARAGGEEMKGKTEGVIMFLWQPSGIVGRSQKKVCGDALWVQILAWLLWCRGAGVAAAMVSALATGGDGAVGSALGSVGDNIGTFGVDVCVEIVRCAGGDGVACGRAVVSADVMLPIGVVLLMLLVLSGSSAAEVAATVVLC